MKEGPNEILITVKTSDNEEIVYKINVNKEKKEEIELKEDNQNKKIVIIASITAICVIVLLSVIKIRKK